MICLQPFDDCNPTLVNSVYRKMQQNIPGLKLAKPVALPASAWYKERGRYRADTIIHLLGKQAGDSVIFIGITTRDISTSNGKIKDWGVMGLGFQPGNACVVSSFRLNKANTAGQLYKVCLHELGHNMGLPHCNVSYCFMRDAEGHNYTDEETAFCGRCRKLLIQRGMVF